MARARPSSSKNAIVSAGLYFKWGRDVNSFDRRKELMKKRRLAIANIRFEEDFRSGGRHMLESLFETARGSRLL